MKVNSMRNEKLNFTTCQKSSTSRVKKTRCKMMVCVAADSIKIDEFNASVDSIIVSSYNLQIIVPRLNFIAN